MTKQRLLWSAIALCALVTIVVILIRIFWPEPTTRTTARNFRDCIEDRDAGCALQFIHPGEIRRLGLTEAKIAQLFDIIDAETGYFDAEPIDTEAFEDDVNTLSFNMGRESKTHLLPLSFQAMPTEHGPKVVGFVLSLSYLPVVTSTPKGQPRARGLAKVRLQREHAIWAQENLAPIGIEGMVYPLGSGSEDGLAFLSWEQAKERAEKGINRMETRAAAQEP